MASKVKLKWEWQKNFERWVTRWGLVSGEVEVIHSGNKTGYTLRLRLHYHGSTIMLLQSGGVYPTPEEAQSAAESALNAFLDELKKAEE